jgi:hypothetical protein
MSNQNNLSSQADKFFKIANIHYARHSIDKAIEFWEKTLEIQPDSAIVKNNIGLAYIEKGLIQSAIDYFNEAISLDPKMEVVYENLNKAYSKVGEKESALKIYKKLLEIRGEEQNKERVELKKLDSESDIANNWKESFISISNQIYQNTNYSPQIDISLIENQLLKFYDEVISIKSIKPSLLQGLALQQRLRKISSIPNLLKKLPKLEWTQMWLRFRNKYGITGHNAKLFSKSKKKIPNIRLSQTQLIIGSTLVFLLIASLLTFRIIYKDIKPKPILKPAEINDTTSTYEHTNEQILKEQKTEEQKDVVIVISEANMRRGPGTQYPIIRPLQGGTKLYKLEVKEGWYKVSIADDKNNIEGWVYSTLVKAETK